ncbi:hypothetical protein COU01_01115 [Candidatus Falkowbacteria bacterium CG10_big_fil_rev_8_21_14_0_10_44_15]|uniref:Uncharacterized protein n=1 Tax=Candidatus Falkowbacteria bacterium CG10_big_fil_rev_8_21_14_0_10_44_15 TaxID=1974569 RepID=A0A2H0V273_9BACT|nr:MAG: hypothetical protein COU01_01115 [Candidatus Falkowbacteria bacterium CG10_big_fil_rev_8_21_14_0_10_44_15]
MKFIIKKRKFLFLVAIFSIVYLFILYHPLEIMAQGTQPSFQLPNYMPTDGSWGQVGDNWEYTFNASATGNRRTYVYNVKGELQYIYGGEETSKELLWSSNSISTAIITIVSWIVYPFVYITGLLLNLMISVLVSIASYNDFIKVDAVVKGWVIVRDLCNMFFVLMLLTIAFATILRIESYQVKKALPKLIIAAVLINFSRTIFGLIIDFGQVAMLTFVNSFAGSPSQFVEIFQIKQYLSISPQDTTTQVVGTLATLGAIVAGLAAMLITLVLVIVMTAILLMRVIMLWVYTILSPFVFLGSAFPAAQKYTSQIWGDFTKQVIVGPMLAFFIWLALNTATTSSNQIIANSKEITSSFQSQTGVAEQQVCAGINALFCEKNLQRFLITIALLIGGLMVTQQMGGFAGQMAGKGMGWIQSGKGLAWGGLKTGADWLNRMQWEGGALKRFGWKGTGVDLNLKRGWGTLTGKMEDMKKKQITSGMERSKQVMDSHGRMWGALAMTGNAGDAWEQVTTWKGFNQRFLQGTRLGIFGTGGGKGLNLKQERELAKLEDTYEKDEATGEVKKDADGKPIIKEEGEETQLKDLKAQRANVINREQEQKLKDERNSLHSEIGDLMKVRSAAQASLDELERKFKAGEKKEGGKDVLYVDIEKAKGEVEQEQIMLDKKIARRGKVNQLLGNVDDEKAAGLDKQISAKKRYINAIKTKAGEYAPLYQFEAIAAEHKAVQEEMGKIKGIDDADELVRILKDAIERKDKTQVKAVMQKLTDDYNDNEAFEALVPRTGSGYEGLQQLMRSLSGQLNEKDLGYNKEYVDHLRSLNAGFNKDEAFRLGAQIAEMNKHTNHWEATAAYVMEGGKFRETTEREHTEIASAEFGKKGPQANLRDSNRLAYGKHWYDEEGNKHYEVTKIGQIMLQSFDVPRMISRLPENMTESAAKHVMKTALRMEKAGKLRQNDQGKTLARSITEKAGSAEAGEGGFDKQFDELLTDVDVV